MLWSDPVARSPQQGHLFRQRCTVRGKLWHACEARVVSAPVVSHPAEKRSAFGFQQLHPEARWTAACFLLLG